MSHLSGQAIHVRGTCNRPNTWPGAPVRIAGIALRSPVSATRSDGCPPGCPYGPMCSMLVRYERVCRRHVGPRQGHCPDARPPPADRPGIWKTSDPPASRVRSGEINLAAVARVVAEQLWDTGERSDQDVELPRGLKDRVARALEGTVLTIETLQWFIDAFHIRADHARRLHSTYVGDQMPLVVGTLARPRPLVVDQRHRTVAVFEHHRLGANGLPSNIRRCTRLPLLSCQLTVMSMFLMCPAPT